ncbi:hypothetical protein [Mangrovicoccus ximenensis]|uniref:hypothetical protein n=1 Tax=Mangrovicoccus ximenensis TaxID=1911570 RepID=UPI0011AE3501|nr:hypothetical protein [Mangrovicoccus ximenensis]
MRLNIISWNIRHLRFDKVEDFMDEILDQTAEGHILFFYENKQSNDMGRDFVDIFEHGLTPRAAANGDMRREWGGYRYQVGTGEFVWIVYSKRVDHPTKHGTVKTFRLDLAAQHQWDAELHRLGLEALKACMIDTVRFDLAFGRAEFRIPAVVHFNLTNMTARPGCCGSRAGMRRGRPRARRRC